MQVIRQEFNPNSAASSRETENNRPGVSEPGCLFLYEDDGPDLEWLLGCSDEAMWPHGNERDWVLSFCSGRGAALM